MDLKLRPGAATNATAVGTTANARRWTVGECEAAQDARDTTWVEPRIDAEITYGEITDDTMARQSGVHRAQGVCSTLPPRNRDQGVCSRRIPLTMMFHDCARKLAADLTTARRRRRRPLSSTLRMEG